MNQEIAVSDVVFREDLYPRIETSAATVQKYADDLGVLPPIEVNQRNELIDGWHRWTAHRKAEAENIRISVTETKSDADLLELAIQRNAAHGLQLSQEDKRDMARKIYSSTPERDGKAKKAELAILLSVSERVVFDWLSRIDKDSKEARNKRIFALWLACHTQQEIAEQCDCSRIPVEEVLNESADLQKYSKSDQSAAEHASDFEPPIYGIWKKQKKSNGSSHPGNTEIRWLDNLLYLYTQPFDVVMDPFAGGGSTIDLCKKRFRRYFVSDRKPILEREEEIRKHDLIGGLPGVHNWKDVKLVYLDPPYWWQTKGKYSEDASDLANMPLEEFTETLAGIVKAFSKKLNGAYIALAIQPTQWNAPDRQFTDHVADLLRLIKLSVDMRFSVPYESQQCNAQITDWAKLNKKCLVLTREIIVWHVLCPKKNDTEPATSPTLRGIDWNQSDALLVNQSRDNYR